MVVFFGRIGTKISCLRKKALKNGSEKLADDILFHKFVQFVFFKQWKALKEYANNKGIKIIGDMPIFIAYDSADLWAHKDLFQLTKKANLKLLPVFRQTILVKQDSCGEIRFTDGKRWKKMIFCGGDKDSLSCLELLT